MTWQESTIPADLWRERIRKALNTGEGIPTTGWLWWKRRREVSRVCLQLLAMSAGGVRDARRHVNEMALYAPQGGSSAVRNLYLDTLALAREWLEQEITRYKAGP